MSVHPYRSSSPESVEEDWTALEKLIAQYAPPEKSIYLISSEWGYSSQTGGLSATMQADYAVRQYLINIASSANLSIWYDWKNDGSNRTYNEDNFGTVHQNLQPKAAYKAIEKVAKLLHGFHAVLMVGYARDISKPMVYCELFVRNRHSANSPLTASNTKFMIWVDATHPVVTNLCGLSQFSVTPMPRLAPIQVDRFMQRFCPHFKIQ